MARGSVDQASVPLARIASPAFVYKHNGKGNLTPLPNIDCLSVACRSGAEPRKAVLRYKLDNSDPSSPFPASLSDLFGAGASGPFVLQPDDRVMVQYSYDGQTFVTHFDGHASIPELSFAGGSMNVLVNCYGVEARLRDQPVEGAVYRDADDPNDSTKTPIVTGLPVRFNPCDHLNQALPNATPSGKDSQAGGFKAGDSNGKYPVFCEPGIERDGVTLQSWTVGSAIRYLLWRNNPDQTFVQNPDTSNIDNKFMSVGQSTDPDDPGVALTPLAIRDYDATGRTCIDAINDLCEANGYSVRFRIGGSAAVPRTMLDFYRKDGFASGVAPKDVLLQPYGFPLDPSRTNVSQAQVTQEILQVVNAYSIETAPLRYEVSVVLGPGFIATAGDESQANLPKYIKGNWTAATDAVTMNKYRLYHANEIGDGIWDQKAKKISTVPIDFAKVFDVGTDGKPLPAGVRTWVRRYRPALPRLVNRGQTDQAMPARLDLSRNYAGATATLWDGTGDWQPVVAGWSLCDDMLGIRVTCENPEEWGIGHYLGTKSQNPGPAVRGVTSIANPAAPADALHAPFFLRLTCVIEGDYGIDASADRRSISPTNFEIRREIDARDNFLKETIHSSSAVPKGQATPRDDTKAATAYAENYRSATEVAPTGGQITIPRITNAYGLGDRIRSIAGRDVSLASGAGTQDGQTPRYPMVSGVTWTFNPQQSTVLTLTDHASHPLSL